jgi:DNA-binding MarR family transcriptional regulator
VDGQDVPWLDASEDASWRRLMTLMVQLPWTLECQLQRDAGLSVVEYHVLAMLSEQPGHSLRMSELSALTNASLSRLSHLFTRLESRTLVRREPDPEDGRYTLAVLTQEGHRHLVASAPAHVREVRRVVLDALTPQQVEALGTIAGRVLESLHRPSPS